jgi:hypothetical protein
MAGCSGGDKPELAQEFAKTLPAAWQAGSFKVEAEESTGTKVDPAYRYRFKAEVSPRTDLFEKAGALGDTDILKRVRKKGEKEEVLGTATAARYAESWQVAFQPQKAPNFQGRPVESFSAKHAVVGSSDYRKLLADTKASLESRSAALDADQKAWLEAIGAFNARQREQQQGMAQNNEAYNREYQRIQQERQQLQIQARQKMQEQDRQLQAALQEKLAAPKQQLDAQVAELDREHRLKVAQVQAERARINGERNQQRRSLRDAHNQDLAAARKRLDNPGFIEYRARADEKLRSDSAALDKQFSDRLNQTRQQENELTAERRTRLEALQTEYRTQADTLGKAMREESGSSREATGKQLNDKIAELDAALGQMRQKQQNEAREANQQLNALRAELDGRQREMGQKRQALQRDAQLIAQLEREE